MVLKKDNLINIIGGGANRFTWGILIGGLVTLITGMIDGYFRPLKCNKWNEKRKNWWVLLEVLLQLKW